MNFSMDCPYPLLRLTVQSLRLAKLEKKITFSNCSEGKNRMRVVYWGTYDTGKPRNRIMIRGLKENGIQVFECHADVWAGIEDKSQVSGWLNRLRLLVRWLLSYPSLLLRYLSLPEHDAVIIGYMGQLDILVLWPFARLRGVPIIWDAFMSLYNTVVEDRRLIGPKHPLSRLLIAWEWAACRAAERVLLDTRAHVQYFVDSFNVPPEKVKRVFVGAETDVFMPDNYNQYESKKNTESALFTVLFYGQFIPLHGIDVVVKAANITEGNNIRWVLIGKGQESIKLRDLIDKLRPSNLEWIEWIPYDQLLTRIHSADVCLGIFGDTDKAKRVIPNKVFQILAAGRPLITGDTPAIRELLSPSQHIMLIPLANPESLARAVNNMFLNRRNIQVCDDSLKEVTIGPGKVGQALKKILADVTWTGNRDY